MNDKKKGQPIKLKPADIEIKTHVATIKVTASHHGKRKFKETFPTNVSSTDIVLASTEKTDIVLPPEEKQQLVETIDFAKSNKPFISKIKIGISLKDGFHFEVERQPSKIVKTKKKT